MAMNQMASIQQQLNDALIQKQAAEDATEHKS
jgi:hypothetical protein